MKKKVPKISITTLRKQAETRLASNNRLKARDIEKDMLIHELQVHQIELEMQNELIRENQEIIEESRRKFSDLFDFAPVGYLSLNTKGLVADINQTALGLTGFNRSDLVGKPLHVIVNRDDKDIFYLHWQRLCSSVTAQTCEVRLLRKDHNMFFAQLISVPFAYHKKVGADILVTLFDISARKAVEETLRLSSLQLAITNSELEAFAASVAHDLRNPLHAITACLEAFPPRSDTQIKAGEGEALGHILQSATRMTEVITDLLTLSKISGQALHRVEIDLSAMAGKVAKALAAESPQRQVRFDIAPGLSVEADSGLVLILLENVLGNAWKYTSKTEHTLIEFGKKENSSIYYVRDNGAGFRMDDAKKLFTPFKRLHSPKDFSGTGIGLTTVKRIVDKHGGLVWLEAEPNKGATAYFSFQTTDKRSN